MFFAFTKTHTETVNAEEDTVVKDMTNFQSLYRRRPPRRAARGRRVQDFGDKDVTGEPEVSFITQQHHLHRAERYFIMAN